MKRYITDELPKKPITTHIIHNARWIRENIVSVDEALFAQTNMSDEDRKAVLKLLEDLEIVGKGDRSRLSVGIQPSFISESVPNSCLPGFLLLSKGSGSGVFYPSLSLIQPYFHAFTAPGVKNLNFISHPIVELMGLVNQLFAVSYIT